MSKPKKGRVEKHNKWGYIFLIPFVLTYVIFQLIPLISTIYNSFFENYSMGLIQVGPNYIGLENYASLFESGKLLIYLKNTMIMWVLGFVPQILLSLLLGAMIVVHQLEHQLEVADVALHKGVVGLVLDVLEVGQIACISQLVEVDDVILGIFVHEQTDNV